MSVIAAIYLALVIISLALCSILLLTLAFTSYRRHPVVAVYWTLAAVTAIVAILPYLGACRANAVLSALFFPALASYCSVFALQSLNVVEGVRARIGRPSSVPKWLLRLAGRPLITAALPLVISIAPFGIALAALVRGDDVSVSQQRCRLRAAELTKAVIVVIASLVTVLLVFIVVKSWRTVRSALDAELQEHDLIGPRVSERLIHRLVALALLASINVCLIALFRFGAVVADWPIDLSFEIQAIATSLLFVGADIAVAYRRPALQAWAPPSPSYKRRPGVTSMLTIDILDVLDDGPQTPGRRFTLRPLRLSMPLRAGEGRPRTAPSRIDLTQRSPLPQLTIISPTRPGTADGETSGADMNESRRLSTGIALDTQAILRPSTAPTAWRAFGTFQARARPTRRSDALSPALAGLLQSSNVYRSTMYYKKSFAVPFAKSEAPDSVMRY